jgi:hypothetical protein
VVIEATRLRAPRHEGGDTFVLTVETHTGAMSFRVQRGWLENLADNANAVLDRGISPVEKLDLQAANVALTKICDQAQGLIFLVERLKKKQFASQGQPSLPSSSSLSPTTTASPPDSASPARTETLPAKFPTKSRKEWWAFFQEWVASGLTLTAFVASKGHDFKYVRNCLDGEFMDDVARQQLALGRRDLR